MEGDRRGEKTDNFDKWENWFKIMHKNTYIKDGLYQLWCTIAGVALVTDLFVVDPSPVRISSLSVRSRQRNH